jgi:multiple sugar transport system permease protein
MATRAATERAAAPRLARRAGRSFWRRRYELGLLAPTVLVLLGLSLYPTLYNLYQSFRETQLIGPAKWAGFDNFTRLFHDHRFWASAELTVKFMLVTVAGTVLLGLALAAALDRASDRFRRIVLPIVVIPMAMSPIVVGLIFKFLYNDAVGPINYYIGKLGPNLDNSFLARTDTAIWAVAAVDIWQWTPFAVLVFLAGLQSLPRGPLEAARIDGASGFGTFWLVQLPLIGTELIVVILLRALDSFRVFDVVYATTRGGPGTSSETLSIYLQRVAFNFLDFGYAGAMSIFLILIATLLARPLAKRLRLGTT